MLVKWCLLWLLCIVLPAIASARSYPYTPDTTLDTQQRWGSMSQQGYVVSGCLPSTAPTPTLTIPPCRAYVWEGGAYPRMIGFEEETTRVVQLPAPSPAEYWLAGRASPGVTPAGWTCWPGVHYCYQVLTGTPPVPDGIVLLARLRVDGGALTRAGDVRVDSPVAGPANLKSPLYGAVGDCSADDTVAVQTWINNVGWRRLPGYAPAGCYQITRVWLNHDATHNPSYPEDVGLQGNYALRGDGPIQVSHTTAAPTRMPGTVLQSTATDAPALNAYAAMGSGNPNALRGLRLEDLTVIQATTSAVVHIDGANTLSGMRSVFVYQQGTGDGLVYKNTFLARLSDLMVYTAHASNTGLGVQIYNDTGVGGIVHATNLTGRGFGQVGVRFGTLAQTGTRLAGVQAIGVQGLKTPVGLQFFGAMTGAICSGCYTEETTTYGIEIGENALGVTLLGGWVDAVTHTDPTDAGVKIGGRPGVPFNSRSGGVVIQGMRIGNINAGYGIWREVSDEVDGTVIQGNALDGTATGIYCGTGGTTSENNLVIQGNRFGATLTQGVDATCRQGEVVQTATGLWLGRRVNFGQGQVLASAAEVILPTNGNAYSLQGAATITTLNCAQCTPGATITLFVGPGGHTPKLREGGNVLLTNQAVSPDAANEWNGDNGDVIALLWDGTTWREMYRTNN